MGYYIEVPTNTEKAAYLHQNEGAQIVALEDPILKVFRPIPSLTEIPDDQALICVVENGLFDAAGVCYSRSEREAFADPTDPRLKTWLIMDRERAIELCGDPNGLRAAYHNASAVVTDVPFEFTGGEKINYDA